MTVCKKCGEDKAPEDFYKNQRRCKPCTHIDNRNWHLANPARAMVRSAKKRAVKHGLPFDLVLEDVKVPERCPVLGIPLYPAASRGGPLGNSPSLDRIIPEKGYVKGNVIVISLKANQIKSSATPQEIQMVADFYSNITRHDAAVF